MCPFKTEMRLEREKTAIRKDIFMEGSHTSIKRQTKQNVATLGVSLVVLGPSWRPLWPWVWICPSKTDEVGKSKKTAQHMDISIGGLYTGTKRLTKQNAATLGHFGAALGAPMAVVCNMPILDRDEVEKSK